MIHTLICNPYVIVAIFVAMNGLMRYIIPGIYLKNKEKMNIIDKQTIEHMAKIITHTFVVGGVVYLFSSCCLPNIHVFWRLTIWVVVFYAILIASMRVIKINYLEAVVRFIKKRG